MNYENWISYRYLVASKGRFLSFLNIVSIAGIAIGVTALIVVTGVMTGFGKNIREKIIGTTPHIMIEKETGVQDYDVLISKLRKIDVIKGVAPYIQGNVFLETSRQAIGLVIRGIDSELEKKVTEVEKYIVKGHIDSLKKNTVIIGRELARYFGYRVGDKITIIAPSSGMRGKGWRYTLEIVGIFNTGMVDYDMNLILTNISQAQQIFGLDRNVSSGIGIKIENPNIAQDIKQEIYNAIGYGFIVKTWIDMNHNLFEALFLEKWGLFIVLTFMVIIASFNVISTLIVMVTTKMHDIGILKSIGASSASIRKIFIRQGLLIGFLGTFYGVLGGLGLSYALKTWFKVPKDIYSIDHVPVDVQLVDMLIIISAAMIISYIATIYPSAKAAKLEPVTALRYE